METIKQRKERINTFLEEQYQLYCSTSLNYDVDYLSQKDIEDVEYYTSHRAEYENIVNEINSAYEKLKASNRADYQQEELTEPVDELDAINQLEKAYKELEEGKDRERLVQYIQKLRKTYNKLNKTLRDKEKAVFKYNALMKDFYETRDKINAKNLLEYNEFLDPIDDKLEYVMGDIKLAFNIMLSDDKYLSIIEIDNWFIDTEVKKLKTKEDCERLIKDNYIVIASNLSQAMVHYLYPFFKAFSHLLKDNHSRNKEMASALLEFADNYIEQNKQNLFTKWLKEEPTKSNSTSLLMFTTKELRLLTASIGCEPTISKTRTESVTKVGDVRIIQKILDSYSRVPQYGTCADRLLKYAVAKFTKKNSYDCPKTDNTVVIDVFEYAERLGKNLKEQAKSTPKESKKERTRVQNLKKKLMMEIRGSLKLIASPIEFKGENGYYQNLNITQTTNVNPRTNKITIVFNQLFADMLTSRDKSQLTYFNMKILLIDARDDTTYSLACKLQENYEMSKNIKDNRNNVISVKSVLNAITSLPSIGELIEKKRDYEWRGRIKERLEEGLEKLYEIRMLKDWDYVKGGKKSLSDEEKNYYDLDSSYEEWEELYIKYELDELNNTNGKNYRKRKKTTRRVSKPSGSIKKKSQNNPKTQGKEINNE